MIPQEQLAANFLRTSRRIAAALVAGMAETGLTFEEMDVRLGRNSGHCQRVINRLLKGKQNSLDQISDVAWSMGCVLKPEITLHPAQPTEPTPEDVSA